MARTSKFLKNFRSIKDSFGAAGDGITNDTIPFQNAAASGEYVFVPAGTYYIDGAITVSANGGFIGAGYASKLKFYNTNTVAFSLGNKTILSDLLITSPYTLTLDNYTSTIYSTTSRRVTVTGNDVNINNLYHEYAGYGIYSSGVDNLHVSNYVCTNLREWNGLSRCIYWLSPTNSKVDNISITNCDGGCDIRNTAKNTHVNNFEMTDMYPNGFTGQPGGYATNTVGVQFFTSDGNGRLSNCTASNGVFTNCMSNELKMSSNVTYLDNDSIQNCWFRNIEIINSRAANTDRPVELDVNTGGIDGITIRGTSPDVQIAVYMTHFCYNAQIKNCRFESIRERAIYVQTTGGGFTARNVKITNNEFFPPTTTAGGNYILDDGNSTLIKDNIFNFDTCPVSISAVVNHFTSSVNGMSINNVFYLPGSTNRPSYVIRGQVSTATLVQGNRFLGADGQTNCVYFTGAANSCVAVDNYTSDVSGSTIYAFRIDTTSVNCLFTRNITNASNIKCLNEGTGANRNRIFDNYCGGVVDRDQFVIGELKGANFNITTDQTIEIDTTRYIIRRIVVTSATVSLTTAAGGIYTATSKGGTAIVAAAQVYSALTGSGKILDLTLASLTDRLTGGAIYLSLTTAQGSTATADVIVYGDRIDTTSI